MFFNYEHMYITEFVRKYLRAKYMLNWQRKDIYASETTGTTGTLNSAKLIDWLFITIL